MKRIFLGTPRYWCGQGEELEYHVRLGVVAADEQEAKKKIRSYLMKVNPHTVNDLWDVVGLQEQNIVNCISLEKTIEVLQNKGLQFIDFE